MTTPTQLITDLSLIDAIQIGEAEAARTFPVLNLAVATADLADEATSRVPVRQTTWTIESCAVAADGDALAVNSRRAAIIAALTTRGERVLLGRAANLASDQIVMAAHAATGSNTVKGYPRVSVAINDQAAGETVAGPWLGITITVVQREALPLAAVNGYNLVEHVQRANAAEDTTGGVSTTVRGTVRVRPDQSAAEYIDDEIITAARTAAQSAGRSFQWTLSTGLDPAHAEYSYTVGRTSSAIGGGVSDAEVRDTINAGARYRRVRRISGFAVGGGATTFANAQRPTPGANEILISDEVSAPSVPEGRVQFSFEVSLGVQITGLDSTIRVHRFEETMDEIPGGAPILVAEFPDAPPVLYRGPTTPWRYVQTTTLEYTPASAAPPILSALMDPDNLVLPRTLQDRTTEQGSRIVTVQRQYLFPSSETKPAPRLLTPAGGP